MLTIGVMVILTVIIAVLIIATSRKDPKIYADRGEVFMQKKNFKEAARNFSSAYRYSKNDPKWLLKVAEAQYQGAEEPGALRTLQRALTQNSMLVEAQKRYLEILFALVGGRNGQGASMKNVEDEADKLIKIIPERDAQKNTELKKSLALGYHCRGVARYARRGENPSLETMSREDINKAMQLDMKPEYVESLAMLDLEEAKKIAQSAVLEGVSPGQYDDLIVKMRAKIAKAEKMYLDLTQRSSEKSEAYLSLGSFYYGSWQGLENSLSAFCLGREEMFHNRIMKLKRSIEDLGQTKQTISQEERRRFHLRATTEMEQLQRDEPEWKSRGASHLVQAKKHNVEALKSYEQALALATKNEQKVSALSMLGYYRLRNNDLGQAEKLTREAIQLDPKAYQPYLQLSEILKRSGANLKGKEQQAKTDEAIRVLGHRLYDLPNQLQGEGAKSRQNRFMRLQLLMEIVKLYLDRNQGDDAAKVDKLMVELDQSVVRESPEVYLLRAQRAIAGNDIIGAIKKLEKADDLSKERNPQVKLILGNLYLRRGDIGAARKAVDAELAMVPNSVPGLQMAATIYMQMRDYPKVLDLTEQLLSLPGQERDINILGMKLQCLAQTNRLKEADAVAKEMKILGSKLDWPVEKGQLLLRRGNLEEGEKLLKQRLREKPGDKTASVYLVDFYSGQNRMEEARKTLQAAIEKDPKDKGLLRLKELLSISDLKKRSARLEEMSKDVAKENQAAAIAQAGEEKDPYVRAVRLYEQYAARNDLDQAKKYLDEAIKIDAKRSNMLSFRFALIQKDWTRAQSSMDLAKQKDLDGVKGMSYEAELANRRGWDILLSKDVKGEEKTNSAKKYFGQSARAAEQVVSELPNDAQAHALLGEAYYWLDRMNEAQGQLDKAMELNPMNPYALRGSSVLEWGQLMTRGNQAPPGVIQKFINNVQSAHEQMPWDQWLADRVTWIQQQQVKQKEFQEDETGDIQKVLVKRENRRKEKPDDGENLLRLAWIYENREQVRDLNKAQECYQQAFGQNTTREMLGVYYNFAVKNKRMDEMEKFLKSIAVKPTGSGKVSGYSNLAYFYSMNRDIKNAEVAFTEAVKVDDSPQSRLELANFYAQTGDLKKAGDWCLKVLESKADEREKRVARRLLINTLLSSSQWDKAKLQIEEFQKLYPDIEGKILRARLAMGEDQISEAEKILTQVLESNPETQEARQNRFLIYLCAWQLEKARGDLDLIRKSNPRAFGLPGQIKLAKLECELGRTADAEREARAMISQASQSAEQLEQIRTDLLAPLASSLNEKDYDELLVWASNLTGGYWGWRYEQGRYYMTKGKFDQAEQALAQAWQILKKYPKTSDGLKVTVLDAYLNAMYNGKDYTKVIQTAQRGRREISNGTAKILGWEAAAYYAKDQRQKGLELYLAALSASENNPVSIWQFTKDTVLKAVTGKELARDLEKSTGLEGKSGKAVRIALAGCYFSAGDIDKGASMYRQSLAGAKDAMEKAMVLFILGQEYSEKHKYAQAVEALTEANQLMPNNLALLNNLAYILMENMDKPKDAYNFVEVAYRLAPNNSDVLDTYGQVLAKIGKADKGLLYLTQSVWIQESSANRYHLGMALMKQGRRADAELQLRRALQLVGDDTALEKQIRDGLNKKD